MPLINIDIFGIGVSGIDSKSIQIMPNFQKITMRKLISLEDGVVSLVIGYFLSWHAAYTASLWKKRIILRPG